MSASLAAIFSCQCFSKACLYESFTTKHETKNGNLGDLMLREFNNKEITDTETDGISWMKVAKIFDRFFLVLFTVMSLVSMLIFLCFYPTNRGKDNPKDFPKEQVNWNLTDF